MCGRCTPRRRSVDSSSGECTKGSGLIRPRSGAGSTAGKARRRTTNIARRWPPSSPTDGSASRVPGRSAGSPPFLKHGSEPTTRRSSSGAAWRSPSRDGPQVRYAGRVEPRSSVSGNRSAYRSRASSDCNFPRTSAVISSGNRHIRDALRARQSRLRTWSLNTAPPTGKPSGRTTSKG